MTGCDHIREDLGGYVLEALEPAEMEAVRAHLAHCDSCAAEYAQLADLPALLELLPADELPPAALPAALEERLLDRFARDRRDATVAAERSRRPRRLAWRRPAIAVAALALVAVGTAAALLTGGGKAPERYYGVTLEAAPAAPGATARAGLWRAPNGTRVHLRVNGLPPDPAVVYELLCERSDGTGASAGTFRVDASGHADVSLTTAARVGEYERLRVVRRAGGISGAAEPADVLVGRLL